MPIHVLGIFHYQFKYAFYSLLVVAEASKRCVVPFFFIFLRLQKIPRWEKNLQNDREEKRRREKTRNGRVPVFFTSFFFMDVAGSSAGSFASHHKISMTRTKYWNRKTCIKRKAGKNLGATKYSFKNVIRRPWSFLQSSLSWIPKKHPITNRDKVQVQDQQQKKMRPITKTDSSSTLVDVNDIHYGKDTEHANDNFSFGPLDNIEHTELYLDAATTLSLPSSPSSSLHEGLCSHPVVASTATKALQSQSIHTYEQKHAGRDTPVIYVHQREVALASNEQYGRRGAVLVSDASTTCHIFALRSISSGDRILGSLCHLDSTENESCIRNMVQEHVDYHFNEERMDYGATDEKLLMEVHMAGGYNDTKGTSSGITNFLLTLLRKIAKETNFFMKVQIKTCIVSSLNDTVANKEAASHLPLISTSESKPSPVVRGLAINVSTGKVSLLQKVHPALVGPAPILRRSRLWNSSPCTEHLLPIHHYRREEIVIDAFTFRAFEGMEMIMKLPDNLLLQCCSTSPECEGPDYCEHVRETCHYLLDVGVDDVFGVEMKNLEYKHKKCSEWKRV
jgi:hypothetical protein